MVRLSQETHKSNRCDNLQHQNNELKEDKKRLHVEVHKHKEDLYST